MAAARVPCDARIAVMHISFEGAPVDAIWLILLIGVILGFYLGRGRAENQRARHDQSRTWDARHNYRK